MQEIQTLNEEPPADEASQRLRTAVRLGFRSARLVYRLDPLTALDTLWMREGIGVEVEPFRDSLGRRFREWMSQEPNLSRLDNELTQLLPNARIIGLGARLSERIARAFVEALRAPRHGPWPEVYVPVLSRWHLALNPWLPPGVVVYPSLAAAIYGWFAWGGLGSLLGLAVGLGMVGLSLGTARLHLRARLGRELKEFGPRAVVAAAERAAREIDQSAIEETIREITVELSPRPLQRALSGHLE